MTDEVDAERDVRISDEAYLSLPIENHARCMREHAALVSEIAEQLAGLARKIVEHAHRLKKERMP